MCRARYLMQLDGARSVSENPLNSHAFDDRRLRCFCKRIGGDRERSLREALIERYVAGVRDHDESLGESGSYSSRVIEVMMGIHSRADRLRGAKLTHLAYHRQRAILALRRFDKKNVVAHLDGDAVMRPSGHIPHSRCDGIDRHV